MNDSDTPYIPVPRDRALVAVDPKAAPKAIAERMRVWLLAIARRTRHDDGLNLDIGQPHPRRPLWISDEAGPMPTILDTPAYFDAEWVLNAQASRGEWRPRTTEHAGDTSKVVVVDLDGTARIGPQILPDGEGEDPR